MDTGPGLMDPPGVSGDSHSMDPWAAISARLSVLQILPDLAPSGPARAAVDVAAGVMAAGGRAVVVSTGGRLVADLLRCGAIHVALPLATETALGRWTNLRRLTRLMREHRITIVHARIPGLAELSRTIAKESGAFLTVTCHGLCEPEATAGPEKGDVLAEADRVIAVSETAADHLASRYRLAGGRLVVITPGVDLPRFDPSRVSAQRIIEVAQNWRLPDGPPVIMLPGEIGPSRGHQTLLEALALLSRREFHCVLASETPSSPGYGEELAKAAESHGVENRLLIGDDCRDMPAAYMLADAVVYARADDTGFARVVAEAQAMGRPIVAYDSPLLREQAGDGRMTWLVPPGNSQALAQAIGEALDLSAAEREALAPEAAALARRRYNRATSAAAMIEVFLELLTQAKAA